jgi:hypothetical protein
MTEHALPPNEPETTPITNPGPNSAIYTHLSQVAPATPEEIVQAADIVGAVYREIEHTQDALNICFDLVRDVPQATTVLATMIGTNHQALPKRWKTHPEDVRTVLSMVGHLEIGYLSAQQAAVRRGPELPGLPERILAVEQLLDDLHGK